MFNTDADLLISYRFFRSTVTNMETNIYLQKVTLILCCSLSPFLQWFWTAVGVSHCWPYVSACWQRPAWPRPVTSSHGASRTCLHLNEKVGETWVISGMNNWTLTPTCARERLFFNKPSPLELEKKKDNFVNVLFAAHASQTVRFIPHPEAQNAFLPVW